MNTLQGRLRWPLGLPVGERAEKVGEFDLDGLTGQVEVTRWARERIPSRPSGQQEPQRQTAIQPGSKVGCGSGGQQPARKGGLICTYCHESPADRGLCRQLCGTDPLGAPRYMLQGP